MLNTYGIFAIASLAMIVYGLTMESSTKRSNEGIWRFLDAGAETMSLAIASGLLSSPQQESNAIGMLLIVLAVGVAYGHYKNLKNGDPKWNYIDGANIALWSTIVLGQLGL